MPENSATSAESTTKPSMRLVRLDHHKCGELQGLTYVWIPVAMTREQAKAALNAAQQAYLASLRDSKEPAPPHVDRWTRLDRADPTLTVGELRDQQDAEDRAYKEWQGRRSRARLPFSRFLGEHGLLPLHDGEVPSVRLDWGHNHGLGIDWGDTGADTLPVPAVASGALTQEELEDDW